MLSNRREVRDVRQVVKLRDGGPAGAEGKTLVGYCAMFDQPYECVDYFFAFDPFDEVIDRKAFDRTLKANPDVRALRNHDMDKVLARTAAGTLRLSTDATGLAYESDIPDTTLGRDTREDVKNGNIDGCSFGFIVRAEKVDRSNPARLVRTILDVDLIEITPVCSFPMNPATSVAVRHFGAEPSATPRLDMARRRLILARLL